jgi:tRNA modification GTPase
MPDATHIYLSAIDGIGIDLLRAAGWQQTGESRFLACERHLLALKAARDHLDNAALHAAKDDRVTDQALDLLAEELRIAQEQLNSITGAFSSDYLPGVIFSRFCIGK